LKENETLPPADTIVDTSDCAIAPGFIDMHSHADWVLPSANHPQLLKGLLEQGITTIVAGNCGISPAPVNHDRLHSLQWHNVASVCLDDPSITHGVLLANSSIKLKPSILLSTWPNWSATGPLETQ
jgi:hypothetical protein